MRAAALTTATALSLSLASLPAGVQAQTTTWWDVFSPDRLIEMMLQSGIMAARTQLDLTYSAMTVDALAGRATLTELELYPFPDWDDDGDCFVSIDRLVITSGAAIDINNLSLRASLYGLETHGACFPPDSRPVMAMLGLETIALPHVTVSVDYHVPSAGASVAVQAVADDLLAVDLTADFDYLAFEGGIDSDDPIPVIFLNSATLALENLGLWETAGGMIPAPFTDPASAPLALEGMLGAGLASMNRESDSSAGSDDPSRLTDAQRSFIDGAVESWTSFLEDPSRLVLETGFDPEDAQYLDLLLWEDDPRDAFEVLSPRLSRVPAAARSAIPSDLIRTALSVDRTSLSPADQRAIGIALATGVGAPRNHGAGVGILVDLARNGDLDAADALSVALETREPFNSYAWGLIAASNGAEGAAARLDRLEKALPFADILNAQAEVLGDANHPISALESVSKVKAEARARLTGTGQPRNYLVAAMWAMIAKAAGDAEGAALLAEIDARASTGDAADLEAWAEAEARASELAMEAWLGQDLPARFGSE